MYVDLIRRRGRYDLEYELLDTGVFDGDRYFDVLVEYAKGEPEDGINNFIVNGQQAATNPANIGTKASAEHMGRFNRLTLAVLLFALIMLDSCKELVQDTQSLLLPQFKRSELFGLVAGFGTTFAAMPDLIAMLRRRSSAGMNPRMAAIMGVFQILWVYYGLLIVSRPVVLWNLIAVLVKFPQRGRVLLFRPQGKEPDKRVSASACCCCPSGNRTQ